MKIPLISFMVFTALAFPAPAEDIQATHDESAVFLKTEQQKALREKALQLMEKEFEKPTWNWDEEDCGSFREDSISLLDRHHSVT